MADKNKPGKRFILPLLVIALIAVVTIVIVIIVNLNKKQTFVSLIEELPRSSRLYNGLFFNMDGNVSEYLMLANGKKQFLNDPGMNDGSNDGKTGSFRSPFILHFERWQLTGLTLVMRLTSLVPTEKIMVKLNGRSLGEQPMQPGGFHTMRFGLPDEALNKGENELELSFAGDNPNNFVVDWLCWEVGDVKGEGKIIEDVASVDNSQTPVLRFTGTGELNFHLSVPPGAHLQMDLGCDGISGSSLAPQLCIYGCNDEGKEKRIWQGGFPTSGFKHLDLDLGDLNGSLSLISFMVTPASSDAIPYIANPRLVFPENAKPSSSTQATMEKPHPKTIVLIVEDACRRDFFSLYGNKTIKTSNLEKISQDAVVFDNAYSECSWTKPSFAAMFTGQPYTVTGVVDWQSSLPPTLPTVAEVLSQNHWRTALVTANTATTAVFGLNRGFEYFQELKDILVNPDVLEKKTQAEDFIEPCSNWLGSINADDNAFIVLHMMDTHRILYPPKSYRELYVSKFSDILLQFPWFNEENINNRSLINPNNKFTKPVAIQSLLYYCGAVTYFDDTLPKIINVFSKDDRLKDAIFIFCSDHGEEFLDHGGIDHGDTLYQEVLYVPLLIWGKGITPRRAQEYVGTIDLAATIMDLAGVKIPPGLKGRSLVPLLCGEDQRQSKPQFSSTSADGLLQLSVVYNGWKLLVDKGRLYNLALDPKEREDLASQHPVRFEYLIGLMKEYYGSVGTVNTGHPGLDGLDAQTQNALRGLGYFQ